MYGDGYSEEVLGRALKASTHARDTYMVATKVNETCLAPADLREHLDASLARLQLDYIDVYQLHWHSRAGVRSTTYPERPLKVNVTFFSPPSAFAFGLRACVWPRLLTVAFSSLCTTCSPFARIYAPFYHGLFQYIPDTSFLFVCLRVANKPNSAMFWGRTVHLLGGGWCFNDFGGSAF